MSTNNELIDIMDDVNIKEQKVVSGEEVNKDKNKIVLNFGGDEGEAPPNPEDLPKASNILDEVIQILECMNTEEMQNLKKTNVNVYEKVMEDQFPDFSFKYYSIFRMILSGEDITPLFMMLDAINDVNTGKKNFEDAERRVGLHLNKFIPKELLDKLASGEVDANDIKASNKNKKNNKRK